MYAKGNCYYCHKKTKKPKPIRKTKPKPISKRQNSLQNEYRKKRTQFLKEHPCCEVKLPGCSGCDHRLLQVHHQKGRIGELLLDTNYWLPICMTCHIYVEANPEIAYENGWSLSRLEEGPPKEET